MFYVFHGKDVHSQQETLAGLLEKLGDPGLLDLNTTEFAGQVPLEQLQNACNAMPFLADARVVIVRDLLAGRPDKAYMDRLLAYLTRLPESARLFFLETKKLPPNHPLLALAEGENSGYTRLFNLPEGVALERWIQERVAQKGGRIAAPAVRLMAAAVGSELRVLDNEIEKLINYAGDAEISSQDVHLVSPYAAEANIFALVDALGSRDGQQAALLLQQKLHEGAEPFQLLAMFVRQFRLLIQVKELAATGLHPPAVARTLRLPQFVVNKLGQQARGFSMPQLEQIYRHLLDVDVGVKTGQQDLVTALSLLVVGVAAGP